MPELPEAETIVRHLQAHAVGATIVAVRTLRRDVVHGARRSLATLIAGRRIEAVTRRAKRVQIAVGDDFTLVIRLGMSGRLTLHTPGQPLEKHTHVVWALDRDRELRFRDPRRFGGVWVVNGDERVTGERSSDRRGHGNNGAERAAAGRKLGPAGNARKRVVRGRNPAGRGRKLGPVGPEPLMLAPRAFAALLSGRRRPVKSLLLDQTRIAGLGNIYCDESLHAACLHPATACAAITDEAARRLLRAIKSVLRQAIRAGGSTLNDYRLPDGGDGMFQIRHRVYGLAGEPCQRCRTPIERIVLAGRGTHFCPVCQPR